MTEPDLAPLIQVVQTNIRTKADQVFLAGIVLIGATHVRESERWGRCEDCGEPWPCPTWTYAENELVAWIGRDADRLYEHAMSIPMPPRRKGRRT